MKNKTNPFVFISFLSGCSKTNDEHKTGNDTKSTFTDINTTIKKYLLIPAFLLSLVSCAVDNNKICCDPYPIKFSKSYIQGFVDVGSVRVSRLAGMRIDEVNKIVGNTNSAYAIEKDKVYSVSDGIALEIDILNEKNSINIERETPKYTELVKKIGDTIFNKKVAIDGYLPVAITSTLDSVKITSNKDYNSQYPAGSDLSNLFTAYFDNPMEIIKNNYKAKEGAYRYSSTHAELVQCVTKGKVSDMCNKPYIGYQFYLLLNEAPSKTGNYSFEISITTKDGVTIKGQTDGFAIKGSEDK